MDRFFRELANFNDACSQVGLDGSELVHLLIKTNHAWYATKSMVEAQRWGQFLNAYDLNVTITPREGTAPNGLDLDGVIDVMVTLPMAMPLPKATT